MSFLQKLWDETVAGPAPDSGLGRLRKYNSFSASRSPSMLSNNHIAIIPPTCIQIPSTTLLSQTESPIGSPTPPTTPPPETPRGDDIERLTRRRSSVGFPRRRPLEASQQPTTATPSVYDWIVITALDR